MHSLLNAVVALFAPLNASADALSAQFTKLACSPHGVLAMAAIVVASVALGVACGCWALVTRRRASAQCEYLKAALRQSHLALRFRDTLIHSFPEAVVVLPAKNRELASYHGGKQLLQHCLAGPDAKVFAAAIDALLMQGSTFSLTARTNSTGAISVRGRPIGGHTVVFLKPDDAAMSAGSRTTPPYVSTALRNTSQSATQEAYPQVDGAAWNIPAPAAVSDRPERREDWGSLSCAPERPSTISTPHKRDRSTRIGHDVVVPRMVA